MSHLFVRGPVIARVEGIRRLSAATDIKASFLANTLAEEYRQLHEQTRHSRGNVPFTITDMIELLSSDMPAWLVADRILCKPTPKVTGNMKHVLTLAERGIDLRHGKGLGQSGTVGREATISTLIHKGFLDDKGGLTDCGRDVLSRMRR